MLAIRQFTKSYIMRVKPTLIFFDHLFISFNPPSDKFKHIPVNFLLILVKNIIICVMFYDFK